MSDENQGAIELDEQELDMVAGGFSLLFAATYFEQSDRLILQNTHSGPDGSSTSFLMATRDIRTFSIQGLFLGDTPSQLGNPTIGQ